MNSRILAIDTTAEFGSIALLEGEDLIAEVPIRAPDGFGQVLYDFVGRALHGAGWELDTVGCFAAAAGPGSFTGVRVGLAAAKGLAEATGRPAVAVSNLQAVAWFGTAPLRAAVLDARRGQVYGAVYDAQLSPVKEETVAAFPKWLETLPDGELEFLSTSFEPFRAALHGTRFATAPARDVPRALAGAIGRIAAARFAAGLAEDPAALDANYVRRSDAELFWRE
ncbi:MAG TPA: tRNA (adenosine(37)-N6)-threonylcarbamoyltransferase complex dimerization subunit type 1 TsaB [Bryobacteraceae bacterium]|nr:tRNA (adenosine(37)-N6)-threonylcarbamoyltransferase complex dimerization subunit type 1 TsaB [Bryobacteraceae bacterium]